MSGMNKTHDGMGLPAVGLTQKSKRWLNASSSLKKQSGVALLMAVVAVAFITLIAVAMASEQNQVLRRVQNTVSIDTAWQFALSGEQLVGLSLRQEFEDGVKRNKHYDYDEPIWKVKRTFPIPDMDGMISGRITDMSDRFNINNLVDLEGELHEPSYKAFQALIAKLNLPSELAPALADWLDFDLEERENGAEYAYYENSDPPIKIANYDFKNVQELKQVRGFTEIITDENGEDKTVLEILEPYITVLPIGSPLNVNRAKDEVLKAYLPHLDQDAFDALIRGRPFESFDQFKTDINNKNKPDKKGKVKPVDYSKLPEMSVKSEYVAIDVVVTLGEINTRLKSILRRDADLGTIHVVQRLKGKN